MNKEVSSIIDGSMKFIYDYINQGNIILNLPDSTKLMKIAINKGSYEISNEALKKEIFDGAMICLENKVNINALTKVAENISKYVKNNGIIAIKKTVLNIKEMVEKENIIITALKKNKIQDISTFGSYLKGDYEGIDLVVIGHVNYELLEDRKEYEDYSKNIVRKHGCCCDKKSHNGCSGCKGCGKKN